MDKENSNDTNNKKDENINNESTANITEEIKAEKEIKPVLPRKRKIIKNVQFPIVLCIFLVAFITAVTWKIFFDQSILGSWYYINNGEYTETIDSPSESADVPGETTTKYTQRVCYEFKEDGECVVTLGTMSIIGQYDLFSTDNSNMFTASVVYQYTPLLYGSYNYKVTGNIFTGKKLTITNSYTNEELTLEPGKGENPLTPYEDANIDDRLTGTWKDEENGIEYKFESDGHFIRTNDDGLVVEHYYTIFDNDYILAKYFGDKEQSYTYNYSFNDDNLIINGSTLKKIK